MNNDIESVKIALEELRDAADNESKKDQPDLRAVAEKWNAFSDVWVEWRIEQLRKENNPDEETRVVEADEKVVTEDEKPSASKSK